jgi:hypothetical protein
MVPRISAFIIFSFNSVYTVKGVKVLISAASNLLLLLTFHVHTSHPNLPLI